LPHPVDSESGSVIGCTKKRDEEETKRFKIQIKAEKQKRLEICEIRLVTLTNIFRS